MPKENGTRRLSEKLLSLAQETRFKLDDKLNWKLRDWKESENFLQLDLPIVIGELSLSKVAKSEVAEELERLIARGRIVLAVVRSAERGELFEVKNKRVDGLEKNQVVPSLLFDMGFFEECELAGLDPDDVLEKGLERIFYLYVENEGNGYNQGSAKQTLEFLVRFYDPRD